MEKLVIHGIPQKKYKIKYPCENTSECHPIELFFYKGTYKIELWGAGNSSGGGYTSGVIHFYDKTSLFLYIGGVAQSSKEFLGIGGYNGGGTSKKIGMYGNSYRQKGGDGATDIRISKDDLYSRIMVSGGSGGGYTSTPGGHGGGLVGGDGNCSNGAIVGKGGNQTSGGIGQFQGEFGKGATSDPGGSTDLAGCGGGGYYGGGSGYQWDLKGAGGGGSSYINGYQGCFLNESNIIFHDAFMIPGNESMPNINGMYTKGPFGNGFAKITCVDPLSTCKRSFHSSFFKSFLFIIIYRIS